MVCDLRAEREYRHVFNERYKSFKTILNHPPLFETYIFLCSKAMADNRCLSSSMISNVFLKNILSFCVNPLSFYFLEYEVYKKCVLNVKKCNFQILMYFYVFVLPDSKISVFGMMSCMFVQGS